MKPVWQRKFKTQNEAEAARLEVMISLTKNAIHPEDPTDHFLWAQVKRLEDRRSQFMKKSKRK